MFEFFRRFFQVYHMNPKKSKKTKKKKKEILFNDISNLNHLEHLSSKENSLNHIKEWVKDLQDPLSGDPIILKPGDYIFQCSKCSVFYLRESYDFLVKRNRGQCVSCLSVDIKSIYIDNNFNIQYKIFLPQEVTIENLSLFVGKTIKFTGTIYKILLSRRGDYALMFEDKPWTEGFKLIVFYPLMKAKNGLEKPFLDSLVGKRVTVRGLLKHHEIYGYEILIFKRNMILKIE